MNPTLTPRPITFTCGHTPESRIPHSGRAPCPACQMQHKRNYERRFYTPVRKASQEKAHG